MRLLPPFRLILTISVFLALGAQAPAQVSGLFVYHNSGQTFLKWNSAGSSALHYTVYRSRKPLRTALALSRAEQVYTVRPGQSVDRRLSTITATPVHFRFPGPAGQLSSANECFVVTVSQSGTWYYAVTVTDRKGELRQVRPGRNASASGVRERADRQKPVFQTRLTRDGRAVDVWVHWTSNTDGTDYPAMTNVPCFPFHFAVRKNGKAPLHPLLVRMHGRGDHFLTHLGGSGNPQEYILSLDDHLPGHAGSTFWFGYNLGIDIFGRMNTPPRGSVAADFTQRRVLWTLRWALRELPIDSTRVYLSGNSMGGTGAFFTALAAPQRVAAAMVAIPRLRFDLRDSLETPRGRGARTAFDALWGRPENNPVMFDGARVYEQLDASRRLRLVSSRELPHLRVIGGSRDSVVGWKQLASVFRTADSISSGMMAFWDERDHDSNGSYTWSPRQDEAALYRYRGDRSWPAFSNVSDNDAPTDSSLRGSMNSSVDWFEPVIDRKELWSVGLRRAVIERHDTVYVTSGPLTATITPRKLRRFTVRQSGWYTCEVKNGEAVIYTSRVQASPSGVISIPDIPVPEQPVRLELRPDQR
jgi:pimeloyl-ACP methyl ester carboxylesterase